MTRAGRAGLAALALLAGCRSPLPAAVPLGSDDPRPPALLARLERRAQAVQGMRGTARVVLEGQRGASFARQIVLVERPTRLRVEVLGLLNQRVAVLATDGERYQLYRAERAGLESGAVHPGVLLEIAGLPLTPEEAVSLLLGDPRPQVAEAGPWRAVALADGALRVELETGPFRRSFEFDAAGNLRRYRLQDAAGELVDVEYRDFRPVGGAPFAHTIAFAFPAARASAEVSFRSVELNPALAPELFRLELPGSG